jgi:hypothetical protein
VEPITLVSFQPKPESHKVMVVGLAGGPRLLEAILPEVVARARSRARLRKSPWNVLLFFLIFVGFPSITYALFRGMWFVHTVFYPEHADHLAQFWGSGIGFFSFVSSFLLLMPLLFASIPMSMVVANCIAWYIPGARAVFEIEGKADPALSFSEAMSGLWWITQLLVPICLALSFLGALTLVHLK